MTLLSLPCRSSGAMEFLRFAPADQELHLRERLGGEIDLIVNRSALAGSEGLSLPVLSPLTAYFFEIKASHN